MADYGFLSDTDDESGVEEVISQAQELCVLEQLSAINCSLLPSDLDSRFRRLKSLPHATHDQNPDNHSPHRNDPFFIPKHSPSSPPSFPQTTSFFSPSVPQKSRSTTTTSFIASPPLPLDSSPPQKPAGCFWCSPKRLSKKHNKESRVLDTALDSDEFLSDLATTFSLKQQQKMLNKALLKEQDKISREAEKIVNWAEQASARMIFHGMEDDELSHSDN